jgi:FlaA1/EpsC-like NDP-sugar epimerase
MGPENSHTPGSGAVRLSLLATKVRSRMVFVLMDAAVIVAAFGIAEVVSLRDRAPADYWPMFLLFLFITLVVQLSANRVFGLYGRIWRHAGIEEARNVAMACLVTLVILLALYPIGFSLHLTRVPLQVIPLGCALTLLGIGLLRFHSRLLGWQRANRGMGIRVAVVGSKDAGAAVVRGMLRNPGGGMFPVAVIDDDERTHGLSLMGVPVVGSIDDLPAAIEKLQIQQVLLAIPNPSTSTVERCVRASEDAEIVMKIVPDLTDIASTISGSPSEPSVSIRSAREPRIEDLLGRREVITDLAAVKNALDGRRVLVTGAGGSIGSEICRQVSGFGPDILVMLDHDETHLHEASATTSPSCKVEQVLTDVSNRDAVMDAFTRWQPDVVFHAAAHKHVPILETHVVEAVTTNVLGTRNVLDAATEVGTQRFVFVSTDKAVRPSSVMGATKRMGERLLLDRAPDDAAFCAVRFGNVLGSRGSVPLTVTDPHMTRYCMSVEEAVQLVLQSSVLAEGGEIYMLEMGEPVSILDLAHRMIRLSGLQPGLDIRIRITGPRIGEKLHEQLHSSTEDLSPTLHPSILRLLSPQIDTSDFNAGVSELALAAADRNEVRARRILFDLVSEHTTDESLELNDVRGREPIAFAVENEISA